MDTLSKDGTGRWNLWEDEEYLMGCVLCHHARKGPGEGAPDIRGLWLPFWWAVGSSEQPELSLTLD